MNRSSLLLIVATFVASMAVMLAPPVTAVEVGTSFGTFAGDVRDWAEDFQELKDRGQQLVEAYNAQYSGITTCTTACASCPAYVSCDVDGNVDGLDFDPNPELVGVVTFMLELDDLWIGNAPTTGVYRDNLTKVTD